MLRRLLSAAVMSSLLMTAVPAYALVIPGYGIEYLKVRNPARKKIRVSVPVKPKSQSRNEQRKLDLKYLGNAFFNYRREHGDKNVAGVTRWKQEICKSTAKSCAGLLDLKGALQPYMDPLPVDPGASGNGTGYFVRDDYKGRVLLTAPLAEDGWAIDMMH